MTLCSTFRKEQVINAAPMQLALDPATALRKERTALSRALNARKSLEPEARPIQVLTWTQDEVKSCSLAAESRAMCKHRYVCPCSCPGTYTTERLFPPSLIRSRQFIKSNLAQFVSSLKNKADVFQTASCKRCCCLEASKAYYNKKGTSGTEMNV